MTRIQQLIEILEDGPCQLSQLLERLHISERTLWRYKKTLAEKHGYNLIIKKDSCRLSRQGCVDDFYNPAGEEHVRQLAIMRLVSQCHLTRQEIEAKLEERFDLSGNTIKNDLECLVEKGFLLNQNGKYMLGEATLTELDLSQEEGSRLLLYLLIKQQIEGKNPYYESLVHSLASSLGKNSWLSWQEARRTNQNICIKGKQQEQELRELSMAEKLELASWEGQVVEILYKGELRQVEPLGVIYSYHQDAWYLHAFCRKAGDNRTFRLDQIEDIKILLEKFSYPHDFDLEQTFALSWGIMLDEEPMQVRIRFYDEFNVLPRLKREIADRPQARLIEEDGSVVYEDVVVGIKEFMVWVRSFGSSAEVLAPEELRNELLASVRLALSRYEEEAL